MTRSFYDRFAETPDGSRALASARLRYEVQKLLHRALKQCGISQTELAERLGIRKSAVNQVMHGDGNVKINTLADYMHALGCEVAIEALPIGTLRMRAMSSEDLEADLACSDDEFTQEPMHFQLASSFRPQSEDHDMEVGEWTTFKVGLGS